MLNQNEVQTKGMLLASKLNTLWLLMDKAQRGVLMDEGFSMLTRVMVDVNRLHAEMFPKFEGTLYDERLITFVLLSKTEEDWDA